MTLEQTLRSSLASADWAAFDALYARLSHTERRRAQAVVREQALPSLGNAAFWAAYAHLVGLRPQAFLSAALAMEGLAARDELDTGCEGARALAALLTHEQALKVADMALPLLRTERQVESLLALLAIGEERERLALLLKLTSPLAYFLTLRTLLRLDHRRDLALRCARLILRRGDDRAINMVCILRSAFGLDEIDVPRPLRIEPYELARLTGSLSHFCHALEGKKPQV